MRDEHVRLIKAPDGIPLYVHEVRAAEPRGVVVIVHGATEHSGRYEFLVDALLEANFTAVGYDHRGHGRSGGWRGDVQTFDRYIEDLKVVLAHLRECSGVERPFLFAHSMGTLVALRCAARHTDDVSGIVLASVPARLGKPPPRIVVKAAGLLVRLLPQLRVGHGIDPEAVSHDPDVVRRLREDQLVHRKVTLRWSVEMLGAIAAHAKDACRVTAPVLILHGEADSIAHIDGAHKLLNTLASPDKTLLSFPGLFHELHNESLKGRQEVFAKLVAWLASRCAGGDDYAARQGDT